MSDKEIISAVVKGIVSGVWFDENDDVNYYAKGVIVRRINS